MGTRLYPKTNNSSILETLAGVPQGTMALLEDLESLRQDMGSETWYEMMDEHPEAMVMYDFQLFGFGKLNSAQWGIAREICGLDEAYSGHTEDVTQVTDMLNELCDEWKSRLGLINIQDLEGVYWS